MRDMTISQYLVDNRFTKEERELLFQLRSKTLLVKENYRNAYLNNNMLCALCKLFPCTQYHPLQCPRLKTTIIVSQNVDLSIEHIYGSVDQQLLFVKIYKQFWDLREKLLKEETQPNVT